MNNTLKINLGLLLIAFIWGIGFVPQRLGLEYLGPSAFNALRFAIGALTLIPILILFKSVSLSALRNSFLLSLLLGSLLFLGAAFQQAAIQYTSLANVAFITGLNVIFVPILGFFIGYRYALIVWFGGLLAIAGLYLMTGSSTELSLKGDLLALVGAVFWATHLLTLAKKAGDQNQLALAFLQFTVCAMLSAMVALGFEERLLPATIEGYLWPMVNGVIVVGIAYTLQVIVMEYAEPFTASLVFSLEAVFGAAAGYIVFSETLGLTGLIGAGLMLIGCVLAQLPGSQHKS